ncbi:MAG: hypothetical protein A2V83_03430 [Nitrospirae bacterium RBG_16_64_22]|nr:MAG: hypothetical protein A2V83_03430 [Nitrospirae bacterium RBG_16_64_22]
MHLSDIWNRTLEQLEEKVGRQAVELWLRPSRLVEVTGERVTIEVPSRFHQDWIEERYSRTILDATEGLVDPKPATLLIRLAATTDAPSAPPPASPSPVPAPAPSTPIGSPRTDSSGLTPRYTFSNFIVGSCNQFAHAAARAVVETPGRAYNPLFLYGGSGLGKTHLMNAIAHSILDHHPNSRVLYLSSEQFTNEVIASIRFDKMQDFRNRYRTIHALLIDDIQFITGKQATEEEFFHTFNTLYQAHRQIILSSDRAPKEIPGIQERMSSRFGWGLIADIQVPDLETKVAILKNKADAGGLSLPEDVAIFLATHIRSNIRDLESALIHLGAHASLLGRKLSVDFAREALRDIIQPREKVLTVDLIQKAVSDHFHTKLIDMRSRRRTKAVVQPRQVAMFLCRDLTKMSLPEIARQFGGKDHTTVLHACRQVEARSSSDVALARDIETLRRLILA